MSESEDILVDKDGQVFHIVHRNEKQQEEDLKVQVITNSTQYARIPIPKRFKK